MSELPGQVISPKKREHDELSLRDDSSEDPDRELDRRLAAHDKKDGDELAPQWALRLESTITSQLANVHESLGCFHTRLNNLENRPATDARVDGLLVQVASLVERMDKAEAQSVRPEAQSVRPPPAFPTPNVFGGTSQRRNQDPEFDFAHIICGGWPVDSRKGLVEEDTRSFVRLWAPEMAACVARVVVYGRRAHVSHIYLASAGYEEDRRRYYALQDRFPEGWTNAKGEKMWMSYSKSQARRERNKATRAALVKLETACSRKPGAKEGLETDWGKQLMWLDEKRVCSTSRAELLPDPQDSLLEVQMNIVEGAMPVTFHFHIARLAVGLGCQEADVISDLQGRRVDQI